MKIRTFSLVLASSLLMGTNFVQAKGVDCAAIETALSAAEDTAEFALASDAVALKKVSAEIATSLKGAKASLSDATFNEAVKAQSAFDAAISKSDHPAAAFAALDIYKTIVSEVGGKMPSGEHVAMLDYAGFKLKAMLKSPDWNGITDEVMAADVHWQAVKEGMKDTGTTDLMDEIHRGLMGAAKAQDSAWMNNAAALELTAVDLLERQVKNTSAGACK